MEKLPNYIVSILISLFVVFLFFKFGNFILWSWWLVFSPLYGLILFFIIWGVIIILNELKYHNNDNV